MITLQTSTIPVYVLNSYLGLDDDKMTKGYLQSVKCEANRPLFFSVYLETGALFSGLPITAIKCFKYYEREVPSIIEPVFKDMSEYQPFSCIGTRACLVEYPLLKDTNFIIKKDDNVFYGTYMFTIDYFGDLADDPSQFKTHNVGVLTSGDMIAYPNNKILFQDKFFAYENTKFPAYKRSTKYHWGAD